MALVGVGQGGWWKAGLLPDYAGGVGVLLGGLGLGVLWEEQGLEGSRARQKWEDPKSTVSPAMWHFIANGALCCPCGASPAC